MATAAIMLATFMAVPIAHADTSTTTDHPNDAGGIGAVLAFLTALPFVLGILFWIALIVTAVLVAPPDRRVTFGLLTAFLLGPLGVAAASIAQSRQLPLLLRKKCLDCAEHVLADAKVCKHCGFRFPVVAPPRPAAAPPPSVPTTSVACVKCQHSQKVPRTAKIFTCEECGERLKRKAPQS
jgi:hypothetical protein